MSALSNPATVAPAAPALVTIEIVSDVVCPWCYIGKRNLEAALRQRPNLVVDVRWLPYQLDPTIPAGGYDRTAYLTRKFGDRVSSIYARVASAGAEVGLHLAFDRIRRAPNTLDAHRVIGWGATAGRQDAVVERLFRAFFVDGQDIGNRSVLVDCAEEAGMNRALVQSRFEEGADMAEVEAEIAEARASGVTGVPFFVVAGRVGLSGAQPAEVIVRALERSVASN